MQVKFKWHFILFDNSVNNTLSPPMTEVAFQNYKNSIILPYSSPGKNYMYSDYISPSIILLLVALDVFCRRRKKDI